VGVDTKNLQALKEPNGPVIFALVARMLIDKGVASLVNLLLLQKS